MARFACSCNGCAQIAPSLKQVCFRLEPWLLDGCLSSCSCIPESNRFAISCLGKVPCVESVACVWSSATQGTVA